MTDIDLLRRLEEVEAKLRLFTGVQLTDADMIQRLRVTNLTPSDTNVLQWDDTAKLIRWGAGSLAGTGHVIEDEGTPKTARDNLNFVGAGVTVTDASPDTVVTIPGGLFGYDYIIDAAYTGSAGDVFTSFSGHTTKLYATIDAALADAVAVAGAGHFSFFIAAGTYNEQVSRTPVANETWDIHGAGSGAVLWTATGASQTLLNLGSFGGTVRIRDIGFYLASGATCVGVEGSTGKLSLESVHIDTGASTSIGVACDSLDYMGTKDLTCVGSGTAIRGGSALQHLDLDASFFECGTGVFFIGNSALIGNSVFNCSTMDVQVSTSARSTIGNNSFRKGISVTGSPATNCSINDNIFDVASGEVGIDFASLSVNSEGFNITGNNFKGVSGTPIGIRLDAQMISGVVAHNTFVGFDSGDEISGTGGASLDVFHNISDAGVIADQGSPVGHGAAGGAIAVDVNDAPLTASMTTLDLRSGLDATEAGGEVELLLDPSEFFYDAIVDGAGLDAKFHVTIQAASDAAAATIFVLNGTYSGNTTAAAGVDLIQGEGREATIITGTLTTSDDTIVQGLNMQNTLSLGANSKAQSCKFTAAGRVTSADSCEVSGNTFLGCTAFPVFTGSGSGQKVVSNFFSTFGSTTEEVDIIDTLGNNSLVTGNRFYDVFTRACLINTRGDASNSVFSNNITNILVGGFLGMDGGFVVMSGNVIRASTNQNNMHAVRHVDAANVTASFGYPIIGGAITNTVANPTVVTTTVVHGLVTGNQVVIAGSNSTPTINGTRTVTVLSTTTFSVAVNVTIAGTAGTVHKVVDTTEAKSEAGIAFELLATGGTVGANGQCHYDGHSDIKFRAVQYDLETIGVTGVVTYEYWNGTAWTALTVTAGPGSANFTSVDLNIRFDPPADWARTTVVTTAAGGTTSAYWIRTRVTTAYTVAPTANLITIPTHFCFWLGYNTPANNLQGWEVVNNVVNNVRHTVVTHQTAATVKQGVIAGNVNLLGHIFGQVNAGQVAVTNNVHISGITFWDWRWNTGVDQVIGGNVIVGVTTPMKGTIPATASIGLNIGYGMRGQIVTPEVDRELDLGTSTKRLRTIWAGGGLHLDFKAKTADYPITADDFGIGMDATGGARIVTLPSALDNQLIQVWKTDTSANTVTVARAGSNTIERPGLSGATSLVIGSQNGVVSLLSDGVSKWYQQGDISL